jgi:hypothetical protein
LTARLTPRGRQTLIAIALWTAGGAIYLAWYSRHSIIESINVLIFGLTSLAMVAAGVILAFLLRPRRRGSLKRQEDEQPGADADASDGFPGERTDAVRSREPYNAP